jgi:hypothetical protein
MKQYISKAATPTTLTNLKQWSVSLQKQARCMLQSCANQTHTYEAGVNHNANASVK